MERKYWIWFSRLKKIKVKTKEKLLETYKTPQKIWELSFFELQKNEFLTKQDLNEILNKDYRLNLKQYEDYMLKNEIKMLNLYDEIYPEKLKNIYDRPIVLFYKGDIELLKLNSVAMVGTRKCSDYGKSTSFELAYNLAKTNICIVSGLAKGIDEYSHKGTLEAKGKTIAVIGNGLDNIYPEENKELAKRILENNGLIISEYVIGTRPEKSFFPARNRIISALADKIIVIEAPEKSGALITAEFGLEYGKDVYAVPGNIDSPNSKGTNSLIKDGAYIFTDFKDLL